jgi:hypothetical protein
MRALIVTAAVCGASLARADDAAFCERIWPTQHRPSASDTRHCAGYWLENYGGDSPKDQDVLWDLTSHDLERLAAEIEKACGARCERHDSPSPLTEAAALLRDTARSHFDLVDRASHRSIVPVLGKLLRGERIEAVEAIHWSSVTLARFIAAPYARHGRPFRAPDLTRFYYGDRGPEAGTTDLLPRRQDPRYTDARLTKEDHHNLTVLARVDSGDLMAGGVLEGRFCRRYCSEREIGGAGPCGACTRDHFVDGEARVSFCEKTWPAPAPPDRARDAECADYFERRYTDQAGKPKLATEIVMRLSTRQLRGLAQRLRDAQLAQDYPRAIEFFEAAAASHYDLVDPRSNTSFEPALEMMLNGQRVPPEMLRAYAPVTLRRLRAAPHARHGKIFEDEDLQRFYYGKDATRSKLLPRIANARYTDALLDAADRANLATAVGGQP